MEEVIGDVFSVLETENEIKNEVIHHKKGRKLQTFPKTPQDWRWR